MIHGSVHGGEIVRVHFIPQLVHANTVSEKESRFVIDIVHDEPFWLKETRGV